jgi:hypothetical protein
MQENRQQYAFVYFKLYVLDGSLSWILTSVYRF